MKELFSSLRFDKKDIHIYILLFSAPLLLIIYRYHGYAENFGRYFPKLENYKYFEIFSDLWQFVVFFILMFVIPAIIVRFIFKKQLKDFGFGWGDVKYGLILTIICLIVLIVPLIYFASGMESIRMEYPLAKILLTHQEWLFGYELAYVVFYYTAWEFFFRGFLLFGLKDRFGNMNAVLIQTISSSLVHIGKPEGEIIGSLIVGIIFGAIALRTRSIWYVFILHSAIGVLTDLFIIYF